MQILVTAFSVTTSTITDATRETFGAYLVTGTDIVPGSDIENEPIPEDGLDPDDSNVKCLDSVNAGKYKKLTARQLHDMLGHFGPCPRGCSICMQVKKAMNRVYKTLRLKIDLGTLSTWM